MFFLLSKSEIKKRIFDRVTDGVTEEKLQDGFPRSKPKKSNFRRLCDRGSDSRRTTRRVTIEKELGKNETGK